VGARFFAPVQIDPGAHPASCTKVTGSFPGVKLPERGLDHNPTPSSAKVKDRVCLNLYFPSGPLWHVLGRALPFTSRLVARLNFRQLQVCAVRSDFSFLRFLFFWPQFVFWAFAVVLM
jgi:hypothetical protein